ncbi:hypothetical protein GQ53DRAFT_752693 [Thozetella sp. PMI_491]|nr:hypothetical protein GQ53DRAFT_752693 [Thozetella sp. PMI_491]
MTSHTAEELRQLQQQAQDFAPGAAERRLPSNFLSLAPNTSESYPREQRKPGSPSAMTTPLPLTAGALAEATEEDSTAAKRRASSLSSDGSKSTARRFLKLGPVHWGEHQDDHKGDWHEVAIE